MSNAEVTNGYCTVDDLREQLNDLPKAALPERSLVRAINSASRWVDKHTGRRFWADETPSTRYVTPSVSSCELWLPWDIASAVGLEIATDDGTGAYPTIWATTDYQLAPYDANQPGSRFGGWSKLESTSGLNFAVRGVRGPLRVRFTGLFGYAFCPDDVEQATLLKATQLFKRKESPFGVAQFGDIALPVVYRKDPDILDLLQDYVLDVGMVG